METLPPKDPRRTALLKKVHVLKRQQGMDDAAWRTMLAENFQVSSSGDLPVEKLVALANHLGGVLPAQQPARRASGAQSRATQRQINYIRKLWSEFARSKDVGSLEVWLNRFHKVARLEWLPRETASKVIAILERETGHA
ncbi:putative GemA, modulation of host genes [Megalodesulfovibrio gigas DSM 1382 = ATCC 19364]|uniref:Putative GemA, modulation of host genes n=1 Tax=Megalodesulfovibrio gigas (strain ATCC 19364 / DSM 1382 / NCIMB 9332 / VKM B-1759) TaxID=1121448 RepID=T2GDA6_MEGG1|nr:putative GemA, modulation of host genes [Megalodesulfovibrio gigas DSM 1382 = ATCC 19364]